MTNKTVIFVVLIIGLVALILCCISGFKHYNKRPDVYHCTPNPCKPTQICKVKKTGHTCTPTSSPTDPCANVYCGKHGVCRLGKCICKNGYTGDICHHKLR